MDRELALSNINEWVKNFASSRGVTKDSIARQVDIPHTTFYRKLKGESDFNVFEAAELAKLFGCTVDEMLTTPKIIA